MKNFIVHTGIGKILRTGSCPDNAFELQAHNEGEFLLEGVAKRKTQKIIKGKIVNKTPEEIEVDKPPESEPISHEQQQVNITNKQWRDVIDRLNVLEQKKE